MSSASRPYRTRRPRTEAPYAAAWREYRWRVTCAYLLLALWIVALVTLAVRFRTWILLVMFPAPLKALCLKGFRCPRCSQRFGVSEELGWWHAGRVRSCLHCGLERGAPADPEG